MGAQAAGTDVGGTFTDLVIVDRGAPQARPQALKVATTPDNQGEAVGRGLGDRAVPSVAHGTTTATNAVLERAVARTVLVTTEGFADLLIIGRQSRPALYDLAAVRPEPLVARGDVVTVAERTDAEGRAIVALSDDEVARTVEAVAEREPESIAICLLFSYAGPAHEDRLAAAFEQRFPGVPVTRSSALLPEFREYERASTTVLNAAVSPVMRRYLSGLAERLSESTISVMTSGGGTADLGFAASAPVHTLLSGPAAGVVAAGAVAAAAGYGDALAFDMGGTSTDVCLIRDGKPEIATHATIADLPFATPAVAIHTVGAGGGSIAWIDRGGALRVGPRSAGAVPGPACYGRGGHEPTVTDAHCALGHLDPNRQLGGELTLDVRAAERAIGVLPDEAGGAAGVLTVVRATMARALRRVSTERGVDPAELVLVAYGGAGPLHGTALARELGIRAVIIPPAPGVLSALGLLLAPLRREISRTVMAPADTDLDEVWSELEREACDSVATATLTRAADVRYAGQSHELRVVVEPGADLAELLHAAHRDAFGYDMRAEPAQVVTLRVIAEGNPVLPAPPTEWDHGSAGEPTTRPIGIGDEVVEARVASRAALAPGDAITGPALIEQPDTTTLLEPGDHAEVDAANNLVIRSGRLLP